MDIVSHIIFAGILNFGQFSPWLIFGCIISDFDKIVTYTNGKFGGHVSRTRFSEIPATSILISVALFFNRDFALGIISHIILDYLTGETKPLYPFFKNVVNFNLKLKYKIILGGIIWLIGGLLAVRQGILF